MVPASGSMRRPVWPGWRLVLHVGDTRPNFLPEFLAARHRMSVHCTRRFLAEPLRNLSLPPTGGLPATSIPVPQPRRPSGRIAA